MQFFVQIVDKWEIFSSNYEFSFLNFKSYKTFVTLLLAKSFPKQFILNDK